MAEPATRCPVPHRVPGRHLLKIRHKKLVTLYLALGGNLEGHKDLLGLWLAETEGAKF